MQLMHKVKHVYLVSREIVESNSLYNVYYDSQILGIQGVKIIVVYNFYSCWNVN